MTDKKEINKKIVEYSSFNASLIGPILADLYNIFEDSEEYVFEFRNINIDGEKIITSYHIRAGYTIIMLLFSEDNKKSTVIDKITLYKQDSEYSSPELRLDHLDPNKINSELPNYIVNFIDFVILYKIKNNKHDLTLAELKKLESEYLKLNLEKIKAIYDRLQEKAEETLRKNTERRTKVLSYIESN